MLIMGKFLIFHSYQKIFVNTDTISIDTSSINPKSFKVYNSKVELKSSEYQLNAAKGK